VSDLTQLRLKAVIQCSFTRSEATNLELFRRASHFPGELAAEEAFLFLAKTGNQVIFIFRAPVLRLEGQTKVRRVVDSRRLRISGGAWSPLMLQNYANAVGLNLVGIKRFEQLYDESRAAKKGK